MDNPTKSGSANVTEEEWQEVLKRFVTLRDHRLNAPILEGWGEYFRTLGHAARDLAFEYAVSGFPRRPSTPELESIRSRFTKACASVVRIHRITGVVRALFHDESWDDSYDRTRALQVLDGEAAAIESALSGDLLELGIVFAKMADRLEWTARLLATAARDARASESGGRLPQVEVLMLLEWAAPRHIGVRTLARRLTAAAIRPEGGELMPADEAVDVWEERLKAIRRRAHKAPTSQQSKDDSED